MTKQLPVTHQWSVCLSGWVVVVFWWLSVTCSVPLCRTEELSPVLVCQDGALRLLRGSDLVYEVEVAGPPQCATLNGVDGGIDVVVCVRLLLCACICAYAMWCARHSCVWACEWTFVCIVLLVFTDAAYFV